MRRVRLVGVLCVAVAAALALRGYLGTMQPVERSDILMDTFIRVRVYGRGADAAAQAALDEFRHLERLLNPYDEGSELAAINRSAGKGPVKVSPETFEVIEQAVRFAESSGGAFDPTVLPLVKAWGFSGTPRVPAREELATARALVDYRSVALDKASMTVGLLRNGMGLDLGAIAKGYATDRAVAVLRARGVKSALIDAGGNVFALGRKPLGFRRSSEWVVGIQHPRQSSEYLARIRLENETAVTSGDYQRYFEADGVRYHHIIDPRTGYPARGLTSVTVVGASSTAADALSTTVFVLGERPGAEFLGRMAGFGAVLVTEGGGITVTGNLESKTEAITPP
ncbi:MAG: FAD:protein FMN transferase [Firmicutes bacterium]|nr:FAD:protein FMN transferase [Bacillota bacterium]